ncbi:MAG: DUF1847 domain-containing protein [Fibrobacteres bacterium]|nr:DUF1847 domain-containing protein [Fibrobacterota bacterium]
MQNDIDSLYDGNDLEIMSLAEESRLPGKNRVEEIRNYALKAGIKRIGIANCIGLQKEADKLKSFLSADFEVFDVNCKCGQIPKNALLKTNKTGACCNPAGQAKTLASHETELNIVLGLCLGHDILFNQKSRAPVTTLIVKDLALKHKTHQWFESTDEKDTK